MTARDESGAGLSDTDIRAEVDTFLFEGMVTSIIRAYIIEIVRVLFGVCLCFSLSCLFIVVEFPIAMLHLEQI